MLKILLVCGGGASSGFLAQSIRREAKSADIEIDVIARSETEINSYKNDIDVLLVGPHLRYLLQDIEEKVKDTNVKVGLIDQTVYATMNGSAALEQIFKLMEEK